MLTWRATISDKGVQWAHRTWLFKKRPLQFFPVVLTHQKCYFMYMYVCLSELLLEVTPHSGMFAPSELLLVSPRSGLCVLE